ncbi:hypothetical protein CC2G_003349 [Coprinopsis cinerea AmutBmut pab1-1]|nr:hypothetical protein CC2G_003349 [Coprinopsis cinerea AmutBmut pab1-1]
MHPALESPDIQHEIFWHLRFQEEIRFDDRERKLRKQTLRDAALTSRAWMNEALAALWWRIEDVLCLFKLLPNFVKPDGEQQWILTDLLEASALRRLEFYAPFVRQLYSVYDDPVAIH